MDIIKLVIWDLDETFWRGTLSDGPVEAVSENIEYVKVLTDRGIMNSVCSKNDLDAASEVLKELGVWELFVFPSINWQPKGERVRRIISDMQLRPSNVLFVDDNIGNLREAAFTVPGLQTAHPDELKEIFAGEACKGKSDPEHTRLGQYKILEKKAQARKSAASNEEFLRQSRIEVELIEDCDGMLQRIHEMIHRNNQLNFTKDRISPEEVRSLFTDKTARSGCVKVKDKYGDHGIVGCYALKDGVLRQFVFSCRILGMGVEQWVYAQLGCPEINIVGPVASGLDTESAPDWINKCPVRKTPKLIVYGSCPLRPTWAYLEPKLKDAHFAEIDPDPSVCNLAVTARERPETLREIVSKVNLFDANFTFNAEVFSPATDYVLVSLSSEMLFFRYNDRKSGTHFYAQALDASNASADILQAYTAEPISLADIEGELSFLCDHLAPETVLLIQMIPEVVFPSKGKDNNYKARVLLNKLAEGLAEKHSNIHLIDIRKYAVKPSDFFNDWASHFNRSIGYSVAKEILEFMGVEQSLPRTGESVPGNAETGEIICGKDRINYCFYISNGRLHLKLDRLPHSYSAKFELYRNRVREASTEYSKDIACSQRVDHPGEWYATVFLRDDRDENAVFSAHTGRLNYSPYNYAAFMQPDSGGFREHLEGLDQFYNDNAKYAAASDKMIAQIAELAAAGINPADYFLRSGISEISIFADIRIASVLLPFIHASGLKIGKIYTTDMKMGLTVCGDVTVYLMDDLNTVPQLTRDDTVLMAFDGRLSDKWLRLFKNTAGNVVYLPYLLSVLMTEHFFVKRYAYGENAPRIIAVRTANLTPFFGFPFSSIKPNERSSFKLLRDCSGALEMLERSPGDLPAQFGGISEAELKETLLVPEFITDAVSTMTCSRDRKGRFFNIEKGFRKTTGQPEAAERRVFIFGDMLAMGCGVKDEDTIASQLQRMTGGRFAVYNMCNCKDCFSFSDAIRLMSRMKFRPDDTVCFILTNWQEESVTDRWHWLNWDAMAKPVIKLDAFPLFLNVDRPDYFLLPCAYTAQCCSKLAELISEALE